MGRLFIVDFEDPVGDHYICKACKTNIALEDDFQFIHLDVELAGGLFTKVVNVTVDEPERIRQIGDHKVANVFCVKCQDKLGFKYIEVGGEQFTVENNMVKLNMKKLLKNKGGEIVEAHIHEPVIYEPDDDPDATEDDSDDHHDGGHDGGGGDVDDDDDVVIIVDVVEEEEDDDDDDDDVDDDDENPPLPPGSPPQDPPPPPGSPAHPPSDHPDEPAVGPGPQSP